MLQERTLRRWGVRRLMHHRTLAKDKGQLPLKRCFSFNDCLVFCRLAQIFARSRPPTRSQKEPQPHNELSPACWRGEVSPAQSHSFECQQGSDALTQRPWRPERSKEGLPKVCASPGTRGAFCLCAQCIRFSNGCNSKKMTHAALFAEGPC